jgi:hypothetical protein
MPRRNVIPAALGLPLVEQPLVGPPPARMAPALEARQEPVLWARQTPALEARQGCGAPPPPVRSEPPRGHAPPDGPRFAVRVLDNSVNTYQEVIGVCCAALGVSPAEGFAIARAIDTLGSCVVCEAPEPDARRIAERIGTIGIEVRLEPAGPPAPLLS